jgi:hydrogenase expression/formation protein HypE
MGHGAGGKAAAQLIEELFLPALDNPFLRQGDDGAALPLPAFPGYRPAGDGHRRPCGLAALLSLVATRLPGGARHGQRRGDDGREAAVPERQLHHRRGLSAGRAAAHRAESMGAAAREAGVPVVTGDTKVVEQGKGDGVFISTTGVGVLPPGVSSAAPTPARAT